MLASSGSVAGGSGWELGPPLNHPRWAAAGGADEQGRAYVYGGYVSNERSDREYGVGAYSLEILDPATQTWHRGPEVTEYRMTVRYVRSASNIHADGTRTKRKFTQDVPTRIALPHEVFPGVAAPRGSIHWFALNTLGAVRFDPATGTWSQAPSPATKAQDDCALTDSCGPGVPVPWRWEGSTPGFHRGIATVATSPDQKIYVTGGVGEPFLDRGSKPNPQLLAGVDVYDPVANTWKTVAPMRQPRQLHAAAFARDGKLYVFGGFAGKGWSGSSPGDPMGDRAYEIERAAKQRALASVECYDPATDTWTDSAPMPRPRESMGAALGADGKIYVVSGTTSYEHPIPVDDVDVYDPATDTWSKGPSLRYPRRDHVVLSTPDGKIYAIGGWAILGGAHGLVASDPTKDGEQDLRATVEVLDTKAGD
jgi:hypothetical protein